jgi:hypothetical protein
MHLKEKRIHLFYSLKSKLDRLVQANIGSKEEL